MSDILGATSNGGASFTTECDHDFVYSFIAPQITTATNRAERMCKHCGKRQEAHGDQWIDLYRLQKTAMSS